MSGQEPRRSPPRQQPSGRSFAPYKRWRPEESPTRLLRMLSQLPPKPSRLETASIHSRDSREAIPPPLLPLPPPKKPRRDDWADFERRYNAIPKAKNENTERREIYMNFYHKKIRHLGPVDDTLSVFSNHSGTNFSRFDKSTTATPSLPPLQFSDDEDNYTITTQQMVLEEGDGIVLDTQVIEELRKRQEQEALKDLESNAASMRSKSSAGGNISQHHVDLSRKEELEQHVVHRYHSQRSVYSTARQSQHEKNVQDAGFNFTSRSSIASSKRSIAQNDAPVSIHSQQSKQDDTQATTQQIQQIVIDDDDDLDAQQKYTQPSRDKGKGKEIIEPSSSLPPPIESQPSQQQQQDHDFENEHDLPGPSNAFDDQDWGYDHIDYDYPDDQILDASQVTQSQRVIQDTRDFEPPPNRTSLFSGRFAKAVFSNYLDFHTLCRVSEINMSKITSQYAEQLLGDLTAYKNHRIATADNPYTEEKGPTADDMILLMKRQGLIDDSTDLMQLARKYLPREFWEQLTQVACANNMLYPNPHTKRSKFKRYDPDDVSSLASGSRAPQTAGYYDEEEEEEEVQWLDDVEGQSIANASLFPGENDDAFL